MPLPKPSFDSKSFEARDSALEQSSEETSRVQQLSSVAPPPLPGASAETTEQIPTFVLEPSQSHPLRTVGWVMVIGGAVGLALVLAVTKLRSSPAVERVPAPAPLAVAATPLAQETPPAKVEPVQPTTKARRGKRAAAAGPAAEAGVTSIRIRARVAPVRATAEQDAKVVCSVKRGAVMRSLQQSPGSKGRWFAVYCDKDSPGWVHENFVTAVRP
jgi:hypothetical protein